MRLSREPPAPLLQATILEIIFCYESIWFLMMLLCSPIGKLYRQFYQKRDRNARKIWWGNQRSAVGG